MEIVFFVPCCLFISFFWSVFWIPVSMVKLQKKHLLCYFVHNVCIVVFIYSKICLVMWSCLLDLHLSDFVIMLICFLYYYYYCCSCYYYYYYYYRKEQTLGIKRMHSLLDTMGGVSNLRMYILGAWLSLYYVMFYHSYRLTFG